MVTNNPLPVPSSALRGSVQKTFVPAKILSGFTDANHFQLLTGEFLNTLSSTDRTDVLSEADATRAFAGSLPPLPPQSVIVRDIAGAHVDAIRADPLFAQIYGQRPHRFCYINPSGVLALQAWVEPRADNVPSTEDELLEFALPRKWDVPAEVSFISPVGPIQILSSNPGLQGLAIELDVAAGKVMLGAPKHLNLVQVVSFQGRYFLRNGYHRVFDAVSAGLQELPALVVDAFTPNDVALAGNTTFNLGHVLGLARPPLVADFNTPAALTTSVRERRYGVIVSLDIKQLNIGI